MFGESSKEIFSAVAFHRARVTNSSGPQTELAFALVKDRVAPMKMMTVSKLELQASLLAARLKQDNCRALIVKSTGLLCGSTALLSINGLTLQPRTQYLLQTLFEGSQNTLALMKATTMPQVILSAEADTCGMSAEVLQSKSWVRGPVNPKNQAIPVRTKHRSS